MYANKVTVYNKTANLAPKEEYSKLSSFLILQSFGSTEFFQSL